jgi:UDP-N-acetylglucosamine transferase subunit ALG13
VILDKPTAQKEDVIFATVGATLPFDRMVASVAQLKNEGAISERVVIQTGVGGLAPEGLEVHETLPFGQIESLLKKATVVICHGGTGSIITALRRGLSRHRRAAPFRTREHYDDHQSEITDAFEQRGLILVARSTEELREALAHVHERSRIVATTDPVELTDYMDGLLAAYAGAATKRA